MKQDYLWNKTGADPEIERLENLLAAFRYRETAAPVVPLEQNIVSIETEPRSRFSFSLPLAFGAVAVSIAASVVLFYSTHPVPVADLTMAVASPTTGVRTESPVLHSENFNEIKTAVNDDKNPQPTTVPRAAPAVHRVKRNTRPQIFTARMSKDENPPVVLSKEEKYAYRQLLLALSITNEKLRVVGDTIKRTHDEKDLNRSRNR